MVLPLVRAAKDGNLEDSYRYLARVVSEWNQGEPLSSVAATEKLRHAHTAFAMISTACNEIGVLIDANPGTLKSTVTPIGTTAVRRSWP